MSIKDQILNCDECEGCITVCPTYRAKNDRRFSPLGRIKIGKKMLDDKTLIEKSMIESVYSCTMCYACNEQCPNGLDIVEIVEWTRAELVRREISLSNGQQRVITSILTKENGLNRDPTKRFEWFPYEYKDTQGDTLLFLGCILSYLEKKIAVSSYLILKNADVDFRILQNEGCCGIYLYRSGNLDLAKKHFERMSSRFKELGIKRIIVPCLGCYRCFKIYYPKILGRVDFQVQHIVEVIYDLIQQEKISLKQIEMQATYHDPCYLGRAERYYAEPRDVLRACGMTIIEMEKNRDRATCCGAGGGVRSTFKELSLKLALDTLEDTPSDTIISSCCFCTNQLRWATRETNSPKRITHITEIVLKAMNLFDD